MITRRVVTPAVTVRVVRVAASTTVRVVAIS